MKSPDFDAIQAFILIADLNSLTHAAKLLDCMQSAISRLPA
jgi:DNA-binding transcriptional LysR family regulator